jgi:hypothetical protein
MLQVTMVYRRTRSTVLAATLILSGCSVLPYTEYQPPLQINLPGDPAIAAPGTPLDQRYREAVAYCLELQRRMRREAEAHRARERRIDMFFGGLSFLLGTGTAVYATADKTPDPTVTAVAGSLTAAASVPAFLTTGGRARLEDVNKSVEGSAGARAAVEAAMGEGFTAFIDYSRACQSMQVGGAMEADMVRAGCTVGEDYIPGNPPLAGSELDALKTAASTAYLRWQESRTKLSRAISNYVYVCG